MKKIFGFEFWLFTAIYIVLFGWTADVFSMVDKAAWIRYSVMLLLCSFAGLLASLAGLVARRIGAYFLTFPAAFTITEWLLVDKLLRTSFGTLGAIWSDVPIVAQAASLVGMHGLSFLTIFIPLAIATKHFKTAAAVLAFILGFGAWRLSLSERLLDYNIRIVSAKRGGQAELGGKILAYGVHSMFRGWEDVDLFVWPENAVPLPYGKMPGREISIANNARSNLVFGYTRNEDGKLYNTLGVFRGHELDIAYTKRVLAIFGEYVPWWFPVDLLNREEREYSVLDKAPSGAIELGGKRALPLICHEIVFSGLRVPGDVDFVLNISNDYWLPSRAKKLHYGMVRLAAISEGVPVVRSTLFGTSAIISPFGRETARLDGEGILDGRLPARASRTLFSRTGNWLVLLSCLGILVIAAAGSRRGRKP